MSRKTPKNGISLQRQLAKKIQGEENNVGTIKNPSSTWIITEILLHLEAADIFSKRECMELDAHFGCV